MLIESIPYVQLGERMPEAVRWLLDAVPVLKPVIPDPGVRFQLVHHDDVAARCAPPCSGAAARASTTSPAAGTLTMRDLAEDLGWYAIPVPELAVDAAAELAGRAAVRAREGAVDQRAARAGADGHGEGRRELSWRPRYGARETLRATIAEARVAELLR